MEVKIIKRGDRLQIALMELEVGETLRVPYRYYSENSLRVTITNMKVYSSKRYSINAQSNIAAMVTRIV